MIFMCTYQTYKDNAYCKNYLQHKKEYDIVHDFQNGDLDYDPAYDFQDDEFL